MAFALPFLPQSPLNRLEDEMPLPLGCEEDRTISMPHETRRIYTYFLAEMSLREILRRTLSFTNGESDARNGVCNVTPVFRELDLQLSRWEEGIPAFLNFTVDPNQPVTCHVAGRLRMLYWYACFSLRKPSIRHILWQPEVSFQLQSWIAVQDALGAGHNFLAVAVREDTELDVFMGLRVCEAWSILKRALSRGILRSSKLQDKTMLDDCQTKVQGQLAAKSMLIACRLEKV